MCLCLSDLFLIVLSVLFPPLPVWIRRGCCSCDSLINIALCMLGYFPGLIHSWYIIARYPPYWQDRKERVYYVYRSDLENQTPRRPNGEREVCIHIHDERSPQPSSSLVNQQQQQHDGHNASYGAVNEGSSSNLRTVPPVPLEGPPPAYSELNNKVQRS
ncbi:Plasma membrane proteolipid 31 [Candida viswanathii]|uniref:Plasma membrane proteolipid 31 n=1 Tax=Candida viswanathii TaxID=5486 RepID=A0A367XMS4_9ASCO|nr:Plasma membrane proteolipid 31 [Candida viswanathii]